MSTPEAPSSYLRFLPQVLWRDDPPLPAFSLGGMLRIFEKILDGIPDRVVLPTRDGADQPSIAAHIDGLDRLFDPWATRPDFLEWLASRVALTFPTVQGQFVWDEYQRRSATSEIAQVYRMRGRKAGLNKYLQLYSVGAARPRVAIDDGSRLLVLTPDAQTVASVSALASQGPVVLGSTLVTEGLTRPWCVAVGADGHLFVGDTAAPPTLPNRVWRLDPAGHPDLAGAPPKPVPVAAATLALTGVVAIAVRPATGGGPETLFALDRTGRLWSVPGPFPNATATQVATLTAPGMVVWPMAMTLDPADGDLLVLDRGAGPASPAQARIITVTPGSPPTINRTSLSGVVEPLSLLVEADGTVLIGDGGAQTPTAQPSVTANLVRITRSGAGAWSGQRLLPDANPLVAPTGVARIADGSLHILDVGLNPFTPSSTEPFICTMAEPAAIYRVDLDATPATVEVAADPGQFVYPTDMVATEDRLVVCDPGLPTVAGGTPSLSRVQPFRFDVVIHFADGRLPPGQDDRRRVLRQAYGAIKAIIEEEKPAHTLANLVTEIL
jgi:phage tail-like protein